MQRVRWGPSRRTRARTAVCAALSVLGAATAEGQNADREPDTCLRFTFGTWTPALDWKSAGHYGTPERVAVETTAEGRAFAAPVQAFGADTVLLLYPSFWPVGVALAFDPRGLAVGDTVVGKATALVADARTPSPVSKARVWRVPCGARPPDPSHR